MPDIIYFSHILFIYIIAYIVELICVLSNSSSYNFFQLICKLKRYILLNVICIIWSLWSWTILFVCVLYQYIFPITIHITYSLNMKCIWNEWMNMKILRYIWKCIRKHDKCLSEKTTTWKNIWFPWIIS